ncbi:YceD family protein [Salinithrix halophila]|uniref:YceD family protein n=1 Tax=Salinithrix halophila TaxID=1485204 RepID=A0ABV8JGJ0_9BACL
MLISFRELNKKPGPMEEEGLVTLEGLEKEHPDLLHLDPLRVHVTAWKDQGLYQVQGRQESKGQFRCSRCLTSFERPLTMDWFELFTTDEDRARESEEEDQEIRLAAVDRPTDLTPYIRESLLLNLPFAPVCQEDCKGLCPTCGTNWNYETCQCDNRVVDPRLAKLEELLKRDD